MPDLTYSLTAAQATRIAAVLRRVPDRDGTMPAADATTAQLLAHARCVHLLHLIRLVHDLEASNPDPDLDSIA
jgi:hypothetical protein